MHLSLHNESTIIIILSDTGNCLDFPYSTIYETTQKTETVLNVANTGHGVLRYCLDRGDGCNKLIHYVGYHRYDVTSQKT